MAQYRRGALKKSIERAVNMVTFIRELPRQFQPYIIVSFVEYENVGNYDNRVLFFSISNYNSRLHKREINHRVSVPLCLLLDFINIIRKYHPANIKRVAELGILQEFPGSSFRTIFFQEDDRFVARRQILKGVWTDTDILFFNQDQISSLILFINQFKSRHISEILRSKRRTLDKQSAWESRPSR